ncbi:MAG: thioredoxin family protein [Balneolaceae bacterium]
MKRQIEIFTAGCPVCEPVVELVKETACESCEITIHNLSETSGDDKISQYNIQTLPAVVVDGKLLSCCTNNGVRKEELEAAGIGTPLA